MTKLGIALITAAGWFLSGCVYEVPITEKPTRKIDERLLGDWTAKAKDTNEEKNATMKIRKWDDFTYVVWYSDGTGNLCRAFHSDLAGTPFVSVQDLSQPERKYCYFAWNLSSDGKVLSLRPVNDKVIPDDTKDSATVQKLLKKNLHNPELLKKETQFTKD